VWDAGGWVFSSSSSSSSNSSNSSSSSSRDCRSPSVRGAARG
jgi:hypothetical protein